MLTITNISPSDLLSLGPRLVGLAFIWAGAIKAAAPHTFGGHLGSLGWIPGKRIHLAVSAAAGFEMAWGLALFFALQPTVLFPLTMGLLVVLSAISWWGVKSGRTTDCGCYGGFAQPSIKQSVAINALFATLVLVAWLSRAGMRIAPIWEIVVVITAGIASSAMAEYGQRFQNRTGRLLIDTNPLKIGGTWRDKWADNATRGLSGEFIVAFMGPDCPYCAHWVKVGNAVVQSPILPRVIGVVAGTPESRDTFASKNGVRFPIAIISQSLMGRLAQAVPTTVLVKDRRIEKQWLGAAPPAEFVDRIKFAFFPTAPINVL